MTQSFEAPSPSRCIADAIGDKPIPHQATIIETGETFRCRSDESLLAGMARLGKRGIPIGCRGGGCGVCKIEVVAGDYLRLKMSAAHVGSTDLANHRVLACRVLPLSDLEIRVLGKISGIVSGCDLPLKLPVESESSKK